MAPTLNLLLLRVAWLCACALLVSGHGRLRSPAGRSSMWRDGFMTAKNYQDNELFCGGRWYQWEVNGGKCGVCGDPWGKPQHNQPPGRYARPVLADCYQYGSRYIDAHVELTANHMGYMQFRLCANNDFKKAVTQECLDENLLDISSENGNLIGKTLKVRSRAMHIFVKLSIPENLTCSQCVLQWKYVTANSWGCAMINTKRRCAMGLGGQESFWACSDIAIVPDCKNPKDYIVSGSPKPKDPHEDNMQEIKDKVERDKPVVVLDDEDLNLSAIVNGQIFGDKNKNKNKGVGETQTAENQPREGTRNGDESPRNKEKAGQNPGGDTESSSAEKSNAGKVGIDEKNGSTEYSGDERKGKDKKTSGADETAPETGRQAYEDNSGSNAPHQSRGEEQRAKRTPAEPSGSSSNRGLDRNSSGNDKKKPDIKSPVDDKEAVDSKPKRAPPSKSTRAPPSKSTRASLPMSTRAPPSKSTRAPRRRYKRPPRKVIRCIAVGMWSGQPHMATWCEYNCVSGFCPKTMCHCILPN